MTPPIWTEAHIDELLNDFIVIPKNTKVAAVQPVKRGNWIWDGNKEECICSECGKGNLKYSTAFCPDCGADMRGAENE